MYVKNHMKEKKILVSPKLTIQNIRIKVSLQTIQALSSRYFPYQRFNKNFSKYHHRSQKNSS